MFPTVPDYPAYTYIALGVLWLFTAGALIVLLILAVRSLLYVLSGAGRTLRAVVQWIFGLPLVSAGSAHFASPREIKAAGLLGDTGLPLAAYGTEQVLREPEGGHVVVFGPPRSWKSTGVIMPALREFSGSCVINDLRSELYEKTHEARERFGPVFRFAPTALESHEYQHSRSGAVEHGVCLWRYAKNCASSLEPP